MAMFIAIFAAMLIFVAAMSVGVMMGRKPLKGSCGGVGKALGEEDYTCDICGGDPNKCENQNGEDGEQTDLAYDATKEK